MGTDLKETGVYIRKCLFFSLKACYRSVWDHPLLIAMLFFLLLLYRFLPSLFGFLVSCSPVIVCTAVLLGTLLSFGQPNIPEVEEEVKRTHGISSLKAGGVVDDLVVKKDETFAVETCVENRREIDGSAAGDAGLAEGGGVREIKVEKDLVFSTRHDEEEAGDEVLIGRNVVVEEDEREIHSENKADEEREFEEEKDVEDLSNDNWKKEMEALKVEIDKPSGEILATHLENRIDSPMEPSYKQINGHDESSDSESDHAESSSPDASMADIIPMLDELHPLLDSEAPQPMLIPLEVSDAEGSSQDHESDDGSAELVEELENQEEEEAHEEEQEDGAKVVTWTEVDEKNLMDLGTSEIERNRRLENLIAKRMARKNQRIMAEKNLIDLDGSDSLQITRDDLFSSHFQIPPISTTRRNPFDLPYDSDETAGLPPIPGSAPSVLLPRLNPFDLPYDQVDGRGDIMGENLSHQKFAAVQQRESYFRRHESFTLGVSSISGEMKQEKHNIKLSPYFATEQLVSEGVEYAAFQRQSSGKSDSKMSDVPETDSGSSVVDQEDHRELLDQELHQESELLSHISPISEAVERESQSSEEVDSLGIEKEHREIDVGGIHEINFNASDVIDEIQQDIDAFEVVEEAISHETDLSSPISAVDIASVALPVGPDAVEGYAKSEVVEENYSGSSSSSSSEGNEKIFKINTDEGFDNLNHASDNSLKGSSKSIVQLALTDPDLLSKAVNGVDKDRVEGPVYDSSPSAIEKSLSNMASIEEDLFPVDNDTFNSTSSIASEIHLDLLEVALPPIPVQTDILPRDSSNGSIEPETETCNEGQWVASSNISPLEENKLESMKVTETSEHEVIQFGILEMSQNHDDHVASVMPESVVEPVLHDSNSSILETKLEGEDGLLVTKVAQVTSLSFDQEIHFDGHQFDVDEKINSSTSTYSDRLLLSDDITSIASEKMQPMMEKPAVQPPSDGDQEESEIIEEATVVFSDINQELSFLQRKSSEESEGDKNVDKPIDEPEDGDSSKVSPLTSSPAAGLTGLHILDSMESVESLSFSENKSVILEKEYIQSEQNGGISRSLNDLEEALKPQITTEEYDDEAEGIKEIDEALLSELDAIGDFNVGESRSTSQTENQLRFDAQLEEATVSDVGMLQETIPKMLVFEAKSIEDIDMAMRQLSEGTSDKFSELTPKPTTTKVGSSKFEVDGVLEPTECNSEMQILEARSLEDIDLAFKQVNDGEGEKSIILEMIDDDSVLMGNRVSSADSKLVGRDPNLMQTDSEMLVLEASSLGDIDLAFKQLQEVGSSVFVPDEEISEPIGSASSLQVLEASSLEDINLALKQLQDAESSELIPDKENSEKENSEPKGSASNLQFLEASSLEENLAFKQLHESVLDKENSELIGSDSGLQILEASSLEDIDSAFKKLREGESSESVMDKENSEPVGSTSNLQILEAGSLEDIDSSFKKLHEVESPDFIPDKEISKPVGSSSNLQVLEERSLENVPSLREGESSESFMDKENSEPIGSTSNLQILEAGSLEDIDLSLKQLHEVESPDFTPDKENSKPTGSSSNLQVLEERSLEDIRSPLKQLSEGIRDKLPKPIESEDRSVEFEAMEKHLEPIILEVQSVEEIESAFKESIAQETSTSAEGLNAENRSHAVQEMADGSSSSTLVPKEENEKAASGKSSSSSSSSTSSSDSD